MAFHLLMALFGTYRRISPVVSICELGSMRHHVSAPVSLDMRDTLEEELAELKTQFEVPLDIDPSVVMLEVKAETVCTVDRYLLKIAVREIVDNALAFGGGRPVPGCALWFKRKATISA